MVMVGTTSGTPLYPMHYWFLSAAFFAFHLLLRVFSFGIT